MAVAGSGGSVAEDALVAVIDDDKAFCDSMQRLLRSLGYSVAAFLSAADFLASPKRNHTACLVADVQMPAMTGIELYSHLIDTGHAMPTILITAYPDEGDRAEMLKLGVECYLRKPLVEREIVGCLRSAFARGTASRGAR
jgi:FixJ family two-component response regulator